MSADRPIMGNSSAAHEHVSSWDGGWYVFEDGQIIGPLNAKDTFSKPSLSNSGKPRMVSRKGFTQWYPIEDFASIHKLAGKYTDDVASSTSHEKQFDNKKSFEPVAKKLGPEANDHVMAAQKITQVQHELTSNQGRPIESVDFIKPHSAPQSSHEVSTNQTKVASSISRKEKKRLAEEERKAKRLAAKQDKIARRAAKEQNLMPTVTFAQQYLQVASRLRLGKIKSPMVTGFLLAPMTLGGYWWVWMASASEEVSWHLNGASRVNFVLPQWMCMIPGLHLIFAYLLARMTRQMEEQNGYRTINPAFMTLLAIFPPFYIGIMQGALNRHWRLHVYHSAVK